jgi:glutamyl-tRNA synthetase
MAPSPTGFLHIGNVRTALFNWLFARHEGGEFRLRIENTDTSREVEEATQQIQDSLRWLGLDGEVTFQLDRLQDCGEIARRLVEEGKAYEDDGAIRFRMPDDGVTAWDDAVRGRVEFPNDKLEDVVLVRSDGRPTYNFASPMEDVWDGITHVIRGEDHISNTPKQINIIRAVGAEPPVYAHVSHVLGADGKSLSKRHGSVTVDEFRHAGYYPPALMNFLALLGWSYDDKTTIMSPDELIERFSLDRVVPSPATFDYEKLDWLNGMHLRALSPDEYADELVKYLRDEGYEWDERLVRRAAPIVQEKIERFGQFPDFAGFLFRGIDPQSVPLPAGGAPVVTAAHEELERVEPFAAQEVEAALRGLAERLDLSPRKAFEPIRIAVTGSKVSPGLFESLELLGREETLRRLSAAAARAAA